MNDDANGGGDLTADARDRHRQAGHADHLLQTGQRVARRVGVNCGHRALMAGIHRLQHVEGFLAAALAEDHPVGTHAQRVLDEIALADFAAAFDARRSGFHAADMRLLQLQFGGVFDRDQALGLRDEGRERVEHGRLARAGAAGNDQGDARAHRGGKQFGHRRPQGADLDELVQVVRLLREFADRHQRAVDGNRPHGDVDARAVGQARVAHGMGLVDAPAHPRHDLVDDAQEMALILEPHQSRLENARALDIDVFVAVDQNVVDGGILQQRFERAEPGHLVEDLGDEVAEFLRVERQPFGEDILRDQFLHVRAQGFFRQLFERRQIDVFEQLAMQAHLGVKELLREQRILRRDRGRRLRRGRRNDLYRLRRLLQTRAFHLRQRLRSFDGADREATKHDVARFR